MSPPPFPIVDLRAADAPQRFVASLRDTGFAALRGTPFDTADLRALEALWLDFFGSPQKSAFLWDRERQDGWFPPEVSETARGHTRRDLKEFFHVYPWGRCPSGPEAATRRHAGLAAALAAQLLGWVAQQAPPEVRAGFSEPLPRMIEGSAQTLLRVLHYPPLQAEPPPGALRAAAHGDINLLTLLPAATEPGLQVLGRDGRWLDLPCANAADADPLVIVNTGDMLQEATGGWLPSTVHRVTNPVGAAAQRARIALPLFLHPRPDVRLSARHSAASHLAERLRELGLKD